MNLALTIEKMKEICNEYGFSCDNGSIYYRQNNVANYWMNNDMKSCTVFFSAIDVYDNVVSFTLKLEQFIELYKKTQMENKLEDIMDDFE